MTSAVTVTDVVKSFAVGDTTTYALKKCSFDARFGELLMIVGPSGCGKTTLLSVICGTLAFDEGTIHVLDHDLGRMRPGAITRFRRKNTGFIFQQFNLIPTLTAAENVAIPMMLNGHRERDAIHAAKAMLAEVGLAEKSSSYPRELSGGQQQRVAISRALVHQPKLLICDEPTAALDAKTGHKTMDLLHEQAVRPDRCVVVVTHDTRIFSFANRIVEMEDGHVIAVHDDPASYHHA